MNVEFLASKVDDYDCVNCFFKIIDTDGLNKLKPLLSLNEDSSHSAGAAAIRPALPGSAQTFKMPIWQTDTKESLLKVKKKFVLGDGYAKGGLYTINIEFILYNMTVDNESFKGYYAKIQTLKRIESLMDIEIKVDKDN